MKITLFSPLESETGLCFCLEVEDEEGRVDGSDVDFMATTLCFGSLWSMTSEPFSLRCLVLKDEMDKFHYVEI